MPSDPDFPFGGWFSAYDTDALVLSDIRRLLYIQVLQQRYAALAEVMLRDFETSRMRPVQEQT